MKKNGKPEFDREYKISDSSYILYVKPYSTDEWVETMLFSPIKKGNKKLDEPIDPISPPASPRGLSVKSSPSFAHRQSSTSSSKRNLLGQNQGLSVSTDDKMSPSMSSRVITHATSLMSSLQSSDPLAQSSSRSSTSEVGVNSDENKRMSLSSSSSTQPQPLIDNPLQQSSTPTHKPKKLPSLLPPVSRIIHALMFAKRSPAIVKTALEMSRVPKYRDSQEKCEVDERGFTSLALALYYSDDKRDYVSVLAGFQLDLFDPRLLTTLPLIIATNENIAVPQVYLLGLQFIANNSQQLKKENKNQSKTINPSAYPQTKLGVVQLLLDINDACKDSNFFKEDERYGTKKQNLDKFERDIQSLTRLIDALEEKNGGQGKDISLPPQSKFNWPPPRSTSGNSNVINQIVHVDSKESLNNKVDDFSSLYPLIDFICIVKNAASAHLESLQAELDLASTPKSSCCVVL